MKNKQLIILIIIAVIIPPILWILHIYSKPLPKITEIDRVAGPALEYSPDRIAHKDYIMSQDFELAEKDQQLVDELKREPNPLYQSDNIIVRYDPTQDIFVSEVTTVRIEPAKREAVNWFSVKGLSLEAICTLPVTFTINDQSAKDLKGLDIDFDPLPTECH